MRASCPSCSCAVWVADAEVSSGGVEIKCPSCGDCFMAHGLGTPANAQSPGLYSSFLNAPSESTDLVEGRADSLQVTGQHYKVDEGFHEAESLADESVTQTEGRSGSARLSSEDDTDQSTPSKKRAGISTIRAQSVFRSEDENSCEHDRLKRKSQGASYSLPAQGALDTPANTMAGAGTNTAEISSQAWNLAVLISSLAMLALAGVTLVRYEILDLSSVISSKSLGLKVADADGEDARLESELLAIQHENADEIFMKSLAAANQALRGKRFSRAALEFNRALSVRPGSVEALQGLAKAYHGLGDRERAALVEIQSAEQN